MRFRFIDAEGPGWPDADTPPVQTPGQRQASTLRNRGPSQRQLKMTGCVLAHAGQPFGAARGYGAAVSNELAENGIEVGRHRVAGDAGKWVAPKPEVQKDADSQHNKAVASNLLDQNFSAEAPNVCCRHQLYLRPGLAVPGRQLDLYSRRVIGWAAASAWPATSAQGA